MSSYSADVLLEPLMAGGFDVIRATSVERALGVVRSIVLEGLVVIVSDRLADPINLIVGRSSLVVLMATKVNSTWLILAGATIGLARAWW